LQILENRKYVDHKQHDISIIISENISTENENKNNLNASKSPITKNHVASQGLTSAVLLPSRAL